MSAELVTAGWFASAVIGKLISPAFSYIGDQKEWQTGMKAELERLQTALPQIQALMGAVEMGRIDKDQNPGIDAWLWQFKDAVDEAEDVMDELEYQKLEEQVKTQGQKVRIVDPSSYKKKFIKFTKRALKKDPTLKKLRAVVKKLDMVTTGVGSFLQIVALSDNLSVKQSIKDRRESTSFLAENKVIGREEEKERIMEWLTKSTSNEPESSYRSIISVFPVVGEGGVGKTSLARLVYNETRVAKHFDLRIWVCVSDTFDMKSITRKILESATKTRPDLETLDALQEVLKETLMPKKFLLVLDDVWNDEERIKWEELVAPLKYGLRGSKILLTTRMYSVAQVVVRVTEDKEEGMYLQGLQEKDCLLLFNKYAFAGVNPDDYKQLKIIGEQISRKLGGSPLLAKTVGGMLNSYLNDGYWIRILQGDILKSVQDKNDVKPILKLSYDHLPLHLQPCVRYCSAYPQDYAFQEDDLIHMWDATGLIQHSQPGQGRPEDIGREYIETLLRKSFFDSTSDSTHTYYTIHDLLHDIAGSVSQGECWRIDGSKTGVDGIPSTVRHLFVRVDDPSLLKSMARFKNLHTLLLNCDGNSEEWDSVLHELIKGLKSLRVLKLQGKSVNKFPDSIGNLIHLRYLFLRGNDSTQLPKSIGRLYHLHAMWLMRSSFSLQSVPEGMSNLIKLRHLFIPVDAIPMIADIGRLTSLQELHGFRIKDEGGYKISELNDMRELQSLQIEDLENVKSTEEAMEAKLMEKEHLHWLSLQWGSSSSSSELHEQVLDCLQPHGNLKNLTITGYSGLRFPHWMTAECVPYLVSITLKDCVGGEHLPPLEQLPFLKFLSLDNVLAMKQVGHPLNGCDEGIAFPSLEDLSIWNMPQWVEWLGAEEGQWFPNLTTLILSDCPMLRVLPPLPLGLKTLMIGNVALTALPSLWQCSNQNCSTTSPSSSSSSCLSTLSICECPKLTSLAEGLLQHQEHFTALESLNVFKCEELLHLPSQGFSKITSLKELAVEMCPKLLTESNNIFPPSVRDLTLISCGHVGMSLSSELTSNPSPRSYGRLTYLGKLLIKYYEKLMLAWDSQAPVFIRDLTVAAWSKLIAAAAALLPACPAKVEESTAEGSSLLLDKLHIDNPSLLFMEQLRSLTSTRVARIHDSANLTSLTEQWLLQNHASLQELYLMNAVSLESLPAILCSLSSLQVLEVTKAHELRALPEALPASLKILRLFDCSPTLEERCKEDGGEDWPKIAHISEVTIKAYETNS